MSSSLRLPTLALSTFSIALNLAILGCAARVLDVFNSSKTSSPFFLPVWNQHFDTRELSALIGTSTVIFILNSLLVVGIFVPRVSGNLLALTSTTLTTLLSLLALIFTSVLNTSTSDHRDTLQAWTCRWRSLSNANAPENFSTLCNETRFAYYTTIPSFIIQLLLLSIAVYGIFMARPMVPRGGVQRLDEEKGSPGSHEMGSVSKQASFDTRLGTPKSVNDSVRYLGSARKA